MDIEKGFYSQSPEEFNRRFKKGIEKERENLWSAEFIKASENQFFQFDEIEEIIETSDTQREIFSKKREEFELFKSLIPELSFSENEYDEKITKRSQQLIDYLYCLHGYYNWFDQAIAKVTNFLSLK